MLTLESGSLCDVCADEFGPRNLPHSLPCGHLMCLNCCNTIIEKATRQAPVCPFCREEFIRNSVRLIRVDFTGAGSGSNTPRRSPYSPRAPLIEDNYPNDLLLKATTAVADPAKLRARAALALESKVARIASKKCSVDEVQELHQELQQWLASDPNDASPALYLSSLLLNAILANHHTFSDVAKAAKHTEASLKQEISVLETDKSRIELELHKCKNQYTQKAQECLGLRAELSRYVANPTTPVAPTSAHAGLSSASRPTSPPTTRSPPSTRVSSPTSPSYIQPLPALTARMNLGHTRSASVAPQRTTTPATPHRTSTPAVSPARYSATPAVSPHRSATPAAPPLRSATPAHAPLRASTPATPSPLIRKSRTLSISAGNAPPASERWAPGAATRPSGPRLSTRA
ncbi:hypothetical protein FA95DRAFT_1489359 [Auriscalpium vulgare]|uniref:Uncharacterized protein n=1 Tax=Auriscalpium vulgare TaxID=40419 RepID=A0ACB8RZ39_9AGAM|nr:hypothetical protein FA95DRAFT_1489359 [Auriscalpium vulgare]